MSKNIKILTHDHFITIVSCNLKVFSTKAFVGKPPTGSLLSFSTNYCFKGKPIGYSNIDFIPKHLENRPSFVIENKIPDIVYNDPKDYSLYSQAGPTLIQNGVIVDFLLKEEFKSIEKDQHIAVGVTETNSLIVGYFRKADLSLINKTLLSVGCIKAMMLDGSCTSHFKVGNIERGIQKNIIVGISINENI